MGEPGRRAEAKERTRRAVLDATLRLSAAAPLAALSLRQVAAAAGISAPSFYGHFDSVEDAGLVLVEETFTALRLALAEAASPDPVAGPAGPAGSVAERTASVLVSRVFADRDRFALIARERYAGPPRVREAVQRHLAQIESDLAIDLARGTGKNWPADDVRAMARLLVVAMVQSVGELVVGDLATEEELQLQAATFLRMVGVAAAHWRPARA